MTKNNLKVVNNIKDQDKEKKKALDAAISQIDQNFGKGSVMKLGQNQVLLSVRKTLFRILINSVST